ncbi:helix-turn-helix domain-containing protein [Marinobacterium lacunae]|uniref:helix-turn-helix domain-containing protein n=1 Tax=Marinobacterium lacunae TaxID=1232683 RepID=UPI0009DE4F00|nr:helix-turn-helix domain-containing protein [Marinobacterium lacunae]
MSSSNIAARQSTARLPQPDSAPACAGIQGESTDRHEPIRCTQVSDDINEQAVGITDWEQEYDQISAGRFHGSIEECRIGALQVFREHTSQALYQQCEVWAGAVWVGIPVIREDFRINGQAVEACDLMWRRGRDPFELVTPEGSNILSVAVHEAVLEHHAQTQGIAITLPEAGCCPRIQADPETIREMGLLINKVVSAKPGSIDRGIHEDLVIMMLLDQLGDVRLNNQLPPSYAHRRAVVDRVRDYVLEVGALPVTLDELCQVACVSRRTLQYSFDSILGISPKHFLRTGRLNRVRRLLSSQEAGSVSDAAAHYGFYHLSQFATDYKRLFGELPSQTLKRHAG